MFSNSPWADVSVWKSLKSLTPKLFLSIYLYMCVKKAQIDIYNSVEYAFLYWHAAQAWAPAKTAIGGGERKGREGRGTEGRQETGKRGGEGEVKGEAKREGTRWLNRRHERELGRENERERMERAVWTAYFTLGPASFKKYTKPNNIPIE